MIIQSKWLCKMINVKGIMLWPFIIVKDRNDKVLINHETIHLYQAKELWVIKFYYLYLKYYFNNKRNYKGIASLKDSWSYRNIPFEKEAFTHQSNLNYLVDRKPKAWKKYL